MEITTSIQHHPKQLLHTIQQLVENDIEATDKLLNEQINSSIPLIRTITRHIIDSGGKRLRSLLTLLSANASGYRGTEHHELAAIIEFVHTATLLHDDVVDESAKRRNQPTANHLWGNQSSVLVGDFLYSRAFQLLTKRNNLNVMKSLATATNAIAEGEMTQLMNRHNPNVSEAEYLTVIRAKTASLFQAAAEIGVLLGEVSPIRQQAMIHYGLNLGMAFQIIDDLLDYSANPLETGKNIGADLTEGKITLPIIYTIHHCSKVQAQQIREAITTGDLSYLDIILEAMHQTQAQHYTLEKARQYAELAVIALQNIPDTTYRYGLEQLIDFVVERNF